MFGFIRVKFGALEVLQWQKIHFMLCPDVRVVTCVTDNPSTCFMDPTTVSKITSTLSWLPDG